MTRDEIGAALAAPSPTPTSVTPPDSTDARMRAARGTSEGKTRDGLAPRVGRKRLLIGLELGTAATAVVGGALLAAHPDGSLLHADVVALAGSPFSDWRLPGLLLASLVGGGFAAAGTWEWRQGRHARELSLVAGLGLVCFELAELAWLGFQPLEAVFAVVGVTVCVLAAEPKA
jgi:hypothetical protein